MALRCALRRLAARTTSTAAAGPCLRSTACRAMATVRYSARGDPYKVLTMEEDKAGKVALGNGEVELKMLFAPVNGEDIAQIEGTSTSTPLPSLPAVAGADGVAEVLSVGPGVKSVSKGDWVVPQPGSNLGTWTHFTKASEAQLLKVPNDIPGEYAAGLGASASAAYRLLRDFKGLKEGDYIIQSAANSLTGLAIAQMAKKMGVKTINVVRDRPQEDDTMQVVVAVGGDIIVYEVYLHTPAFYDLLSDLPAPVLALDAVGGRVGADMARALGSGGTFVSYGKLSGEAPELPPSVVKSRGITTADFSLAKWNKGATPAARSSMIDDISGMVRNKELIMFFETHPFSQINLAIDKYYEPFKYRKVLMDMSI